MYKQLVRPWLFRIDAERIHGQIVTALHLYRHLSPVRALFRWSFKPKAEVFRWRGLSFGNRVGLSAGFDKEASCFDELADLGFGFLEVGTVTPSEVKGNPCPRIFRLPKDESLISRTGFNNPGKTVVSRNLQRKRSGRYLLGININTNCPTDGQRVVTDLLGLYDAFHEYADYFTVNWGSIAPELLSPALVALAERPDSKPLLLKLPADIPVGKLDEVIEYARRHQVAGFIATGPTQDRSSLVRSSQAEITRVGMGGISGLPVFGKSVEIVRYLSAHAPKDMLIVGAGGVMTPREATLMLQAGAHVVQLYSAFIYEGPCVVKRIAEALG